MLSRQLHLRNLHRPSLKTDNNETSLVKFVDKWLGGRRHKTQQKLNFVVSALDQRTHSHRSRIWVSEQTASRSGALARLFQNSSSWAMSLSKNTCMSFTSVVFMFCAWRPPGRPVAFRRFIFRYSLISKMSSTEVFAHCFLFFENSVLFFCISI